MKTAKLGTVITAYVEEARCGKKKFHYNASFGFLALTQAAYKAGCRKGDVIKTQPCFVGQTWATADRYELVESPCDRAYGLWVNKLPK